MMNKSRVGINLAWVAILLSSLALALASGPSFDTATHAVQAVIGLVGVLIATLMLIRAGWLRRRHGSGDERQ